MKKFRILTTMLLMVVLTVSTSTVAFAGGGEYEEPVTVIEPVKPPKPLTPEGNLTLVDDIEATDEIDKQFITAVSKNGNYFYLVIDRSGDEDNVYLLNMVDEADLMMLMEEEPVVEPEPLPEPKPELEPELVPEEEPKKNSTLPLVILVLAMCGGGAFYYLKFVKTKPNSKGNTDLNDFDDDDDYDIEETFNEENMENDDDNYHDSDDTELV